MLSRGTDVYLVSGGFTSIIEPVADRLHISKENIFANKLLFDSQGINTYFEYDVCTCLQKHFGIHYVIQISNLFGLINDIKKKLKLFNYC